MVKTLKKGLNPFHTKIKCCICVYQGLIHSQILVSALIVVQFLGEKVTLTKLLTVAQGECFQASEHCVCRAASTSLDSESSPMAQESAHGIWS